MFQQFGPSYVENCAPITIIAPQLTESVCDNFNTTILATQKSMTKTKGTHRSFGVVARGDLKYVFTQDP